MGSVHCFRGKVRPKVDGKNSTDEPSNKCLPQGHLVIVDGARGHGGAAIEGL